MMKEILLELEKRYALVVEVIHLNKRGNTAYLLKTIRFNKQK